MGRSDFQYCAMDTNSAYMALSATSLDEVIKPDMQQRFQMEKKNWFPRDDTYDKRTPGLFKTEFTGGEMIALCSKSYFCFGAEDKFSCKGVNSLDPVPTEVSVSLTIQCIHIYKRELGYPISTLKEKCLQMVFLPNHWTFSM